MIKNLLKTLFGLCLGLTAALALCLFAGENPLHILQVLLNSAFGSWYDFGLTLSYATPMIFCGLAVAVAFHAGLFNIGVEGQITMAAVSAAAVGVLLPQIPFPWAPLVALLVALIAGAMWAGIAGWLKATRGSHEVIVTIMLNFIAAGLSSWFTLNIIPNTQAQSPESAFVAPAYLLKPHDFIAELFPNTPVSLAIVVAIFLAILVWFILWKTTWGFELRAVGQNAPAAQRAGISQKKVLLYSMLLSGACAGFVALSEVMGSSGQFRLGFSPGYGFIGIAVALLAQNNPLGIIASGFLMAALHKGATDLDLETTTITKDFSRILQAFIIIGVSVQGYWQWHKSKKRSQK